MDATEWNPSWAWAAGQMISTLDDLHIWAQNVAIGKLLSPRTQREREKFLPAPELSDGSLYGLALDNENGWIGHPGNIPGYQTYAYYLASQRTTMVVLANSNIDVPGLWNLIKKITAIISPDHIWPDLPVVEP